MKRSCCIVQADLKLIILRPQLPSTWSIAICYHVLLEYGPECKHNNSLFSTTLDNSHFPFHYSHKFKSFQHVRGILHELARFRPIHLLPSALFRENWPYLPLLSSKLLCPLTGSSFHHPEEGVTILREKGSFAL